MIHRQVELKDGEDAKTITIRVKGTGNCSMETETTYNIIKAGGLTDLTKAKIAAKGSAMKPVGKQGYTGEKLEPPIDVYVKQGAAWTKVDEKFYSVSYINNIEPGTARIVVNGEGNNAVGSVSAKFSITKGDFSKIFSGNIK